MKGLVLYQPSAHGHTENVCLYKYTCIHTHTQLFSYSYTFIREEDILLHIVHYIWEKVVRIQIINYWSIINLGRTSFEESFEYTAMISFRKTVFSSELFTEILFGKKF